MLYSLVFTLSKNYYCGKYILIYWFPSLSQIHIHSQLRIQPKQNVIPTSECLTRLNVSMCKAICDIKGRLMKIESIYNSTCLVLDVWLILLKINKIIIEFVFCGKFTDLVL